MKLMKPAGFFKETIKEVMSPENEQKMDELKESTKKQAKKKTTKKKSSKRK